MKKSVSYKLLPLLPIITGAIALLLRLALYTMENESGLLPHNHPLYLASLILAAFIALVVAFFVFRMDGAQEYRENFPPSGTAAVGSVLSGLCLIPVALEIWDQAASRLDYAWAVLGLGAAICLICAGWFLLKEKKVPFFLYYIVCLYFALHMVCRYREWSGNPQTEDYIFSIFSCIFLALFAYSRAAFSADSGRRRPLLFCGMMAIFFCLPALIGGNDQKFFLAGCIWAATNQCTMDPHPKAEPKEN